MTHEERSEFEAYVRANMPPFADREEEDEWLEMNDELIHRDWLEDWLAARAAELGEI